MLSYSSFCYPFCGYAIPTLFDHFYWTNFLFVHRHITILFITFLKIICKFTYSVLFILNLHCNLFIWDKIKFSRLRDHTFSCLARLYDLRAIVENANVQYKYIYKYTEKSSSEARSRTRQQRCRRQRRSSSRRTRSAPAKQPSRHSHSHKSHYCLWRPCWWLWTRAWAAGATRACWAARAAPRPGGCRRRGRARPGTWALPAFTSARPRSHALLLVWARELSGALEHLNAEQWTLNIGTMSDWAQGSSSKSPRWGCCLCRTSGRTPRRQVESPADAAYTRRSSTMQLFANRIALKQRNKI